jgi:cytochrome P450
MTSTDSVDGTAAPAFDPAMLNPPWPLFEMLRANAPCFEVPGMGAYLVTRYDDIARIVMDPKTFSSELEFGTGLSFLPATPEKDAALARGGFEWVPTLGFTDPPVHRRVRVAVQKGFSARRVRQLEGVVQELCDEIIDGMDPTGAIDYAQEMALQLPVMVIGASLGVAREDWAKFNRWSDAVLARLGEQITDEQDLALIEEYVDEELYFTQLIADRRVKRTDDLLSDLVAAQQEADDPITDEELMSIVAFLPVAGSRTSAGLIGMTMHHLLDNPADLARAREDDAFLDALIEEVLRMQSPIQAWFRRTTDDVELGGVTVPSDSRLLVAFASANRDEAKFGCPTDFRPDRDNIKEHLAFGRGPHLCPGATLARAETRIATRTFLSRFPSIGHAPGTAPGYHPNLVHRMADNLPLVVGPPT